MTWRALSKSSYRKDSIKHRAEVEALGGKLAFPFLVDPNTGVAMNESEAWVYTRPLLSSTFAVFSH
jgi:isopentenyl diphosphate isomerase/L-lactate dehydrogenase-like FMN-dependent dehydrogenase